MRRLCHNTIVSWAGVCPSETFCFYRGQAQPALSRNTSPVNFLLVHSPVVGPSTWRWVADALKEAGHEAIVPNLVAAAETGDPARFVEAAAGAKEFDEPVVLVGHSGAGAVLPSIAEGLASWPHSIVFVDAGVPPCEGVFTAGGEFLATLQGLATNGILPKWSRWWDDGVLEAIIHDEHRRRDIAVELPEVPLRLLAAYVLLSEGYQSDADRASLLGWPVRERPGEHLDIVNEGPAIAHMLIDLAEHRERRRSDGKPRA
jgi:hypothetical protein